MDTWAEALQHRLEQSMRRRQDTKAAAHKLRTFVDEAICKKIDPVVLVLSGIAEAPNDLPIDETPEGGAFRVVFWHLTLDGQPVISFNVRTNSGGVAYCEIATSLGKTAKFVDQGHGWRAAHDHAGANAEALLQTLVTFLEDAIKDRPPVIARPGWEYTIRTIPNEHPLSDLEATFNSFGRQGWECVQILADFQDHHLAIFKRPTNPQ